MLGGRVQCHTAAVPSVGRSGVLGAWFSQTIDQPSRKPARGTRRQGQHVLGTGPVQTLWKGPQLARRHQGPCSCVGTAEVRLDLGTGSHIPEETFCYTFEAQSEMLRAIPSPVLRRPGSALRCEVAAQGSGTHQSQDMGAGMQEHALPLLMPSPSPAVPS